ncbi:MAG: RNA polymerase sigma factor [Bacteroidota bacterium]
MNKAEFRRNVFSLSERLYPMVARMLGNSANAEDAIQEIMMKLWIKRYKISQHPNITGFVFLTARNYCIDVLRKRKKEIDYSHLHIKTIEFEYQHEYLEWEELNNTIRKILEELPERQREVIIMRALDGYEIKEIAAATELKIEHVRVLLSRARKKLSTALKKIYSYEK